MRRQMLLVFQMMTSCKMTSPYAALDVYIKRRTSVVDSDGQLQN